MHYLLVIILLSLATIDPSEGHGRLRVPPARTTMWREGFPTVKNYNDGELNCGGYAFHWAKMRGKCGVCGDPWEGPHKDEVASGKYAMGIITRNYTVGQVIAITVEITANHGGFHSFYLCPEKVLTEDCFQKYLLADENGLTTFPINKKDHIIKLKLQLPPNLTCKQCVLRWKWVCGNRWGCETDGKCCVGCGVEQEHFYGCSDIAILPNGNVPLPTTTTKKPTQMPATTPSPSDSNNPWIICPLTMVCKATGPYVPGAVSTMCISKCKHPICPISFCYCSCPK